MPVKTTDDQGREVLQYESGVVKLASNGHFLRGPDNPRDNPVLADPSAMGKRSGEIVRARAIQEARDALDSAAIAAGRIDEHLRGSGYGWYAAIEKAAELYFSATSARGAEGLLTVIGRATGNLTARDEGPAPAPAGGITATPEAIKALIDIYQDEINRRVEQAKAIEGKEL